MKYIVVVTVDCAIKYIAIGTENCIINYIVVVTAESIILQTVSISLQPYFLCKIWMVLKVFNASHVSRSPQQAMSQSAQNKPCFKVPKTSHVSKLPYKFCDKVTRETQMHQSQQNTRHKHLGPKQPGCRKEWIGWSCSGLTFHCIPISWIDKQQTSKVPYKVTYYGLTHESYMKVYPHRDLSSAAKQSFNL